MIESILDSVKKKIGGDPEDDFYDPDIIDAINSAFSTLYQIGVGPAGFMIEDNSTLWSDFLPDLKDKTLLALCRQYIFYKARIDFDPPASSAVMESLNRQVTETEWRIDNEIRLREEAQICP